MITPCMASTIVYLTLPTASVANKEIPESREEFKRYKNPKCPAVANKEVPERELRVIRKCREKSILKGDLLVFWVYSQTPGEIRSESKSLLVWI